MRTAPKIINVRRSKRLRQQRNVHFSEEQPKIIVFHLEPNESEEKRECYQNIMNNVDKNYREYEREQKQQKEKLILYNI